MNGLNELFKAIALEAMFNIDDHLDEHWAHIALNRTDWLRRCIQFPIVRESDWDDRVFEN